MKHVIKGFLFGVVIVFFVMASTFSLMFFGELVAGDVGAYIGLATSLGGCLGSFVLWMHNLNDT